MGDPEYADPKNHIVYSDIAKYKFDPEIGAVICGIDFAFSYSKLMLASLYIQKGAKFVVTNEDEYTIQGGMRAPGNGSIVAALENGLRKPGGDGLICEKIVTGKPSGAIVELIRG